MKRFLVAVAAMAALALASVASAQVVVPSDFLPTWRWKALNFASNFTDNGGVATTMYGTSAPLVYNGQKVSGVYDTTEAIPLGGAFAKYVAYAVRTGNPGLQTDTIPLFKLRFTTTGTLDTVAYFLQGSVDGNAWVNITVAADSMASGAIATGAVHTTAAGDTSVAQVCHRVTGTSGWLYKYGVTTRPYHSSLASGLNLSNYKSTYFHPYQYLRLIFPRMWMSNQYGLPSGQTVQYVAQPTGATPKYSVAVALFTADPLWHTR